MQIKWDDVDDVVYCGRAIDRKDKQIINKPFKHIAYQPISNKLLSKILTKWSMDFVVNLDRHIPYPEKNPFYEFEDDEMVEYYSKNGNVLKIDPFTWKYKDVDTFMEIQDAFILRDNMLFVKINDNHDWNRFDSELPKFKFVYKEENKGQTATIHFNKTYFKNLIKSWANLSSYMLTTFIDWAGLLFMTSDRNTLHEFKAFIISEGFDFD